MNEISTVVKSDWLTIREAADFLGVSVGAIHNSLQRYPEIKETHTKRSGEGKTSPLLFSKEGVALLVAIQETARNQLYTPELEAKKAAKQNIINKGIDAVKEVVALTQRVAALEEALKMQPEQLKLQSPGLTLAAPTEKVPELTTRAKIGIRIDIYLTEKYGEDDKERGKHFAKAWNRLYKELYWRYSFSPSKRKQKGEESLDVCERLGMMNKLHSLARYLFPTSNDSKS